MFLAYQRASRPYKRLVFDDFTFLSFDICLIIFLFGVFCWGHDHLDHRSYPTSRLSSVAQNLLLLSLLLHVSPVTAVSDTKLVSFDVVTLHSVALGRVWLAPMVIIMLVLSTV